jgi:hypothetical protein
LAKAQFDQLKHDKRNQIPSVFPSEPKFLWRTETLVASAAPVSVELVSDNPSFDSESCKAKIVKGFGSSFRILVSSQEAFRAYPEEVIPDVLVDPFNSLSVTGSDFRCVL